MICRLSRLSRIHQTHSTHIVQDQKRKERAAPAFVLEPAFLSRYFKPEQGREEIEETIAKALDRYLGIVTQG